MAREYRLKCVYRRDFDELLEEELENPESRALAARMNVISQEGDLFMDEGQFEVCSESHRFHRRHMPSHWADDLLLLVRRLYRLCF